MFSLALTLCLVGFAVVFVGIVIYNRLVRSRLLVREGLSGMDVQLKRRHELIPRLVNVVKQYASFEQRLLERLTEVRTAAVHSQDLTSREATEGELEHVLKRLLVVVENYPDLKANTQFSQLSSELIATEDDLQKSRRYYNGAVREFNTLIETFPNNFVAATFGFQREKFFQVDDPHERQAPSIDLQT
jgi:LemA protein